MKRFKNILFLQGKHEAKTPLLRAIDLARRNRAGLKIVGVYESLPDKMDARLRGKYGVDLQAATELELKERIEKLVPGNRTKGLRLTVKPLFGTAFLEVIREVLRENHDLVIAGPDEKGGLKQRLFDSTTMHLMRKCPCPVWVIKPTKNRKYSAIMAAVDVTESGDGQDTLNTKIMELSSSLAETEGSTLHIVHSWNQPLEGRSRRYTGLTAEKMSEIVDETLLLHQRLFHEFVGRFDLKKVTYQTHLLKGQAGQTIAEFAKRRKMDLVVMGTLSRAGISGLLIGNTAERVLSRINASVLTVKPEEFKTPVK